MRLNLALACQRPSQLLRATWQDFDFEQDTLLLRDPKGRGGARDHLLPLTPFALEQLKPLRKLNSEASSPFTADGRRVMVLTTLSVAVREISDRLAAGGRWGPDAKAWTVAKTVTLGDTNSDIPLFQLRDLRRRGIAENLGAASNLQMHHLNCRRNQYEAQNAVV